MEWIDTVEIVNILGLKLLVERSKERLCIFVIQINLFLENVRKRQPVVINLRNILWVMIMIEKNVKKLKAKKQRVLVGFNTGTRSMRSKTEYRRKKKWSAEDADLFCLIRHSC